MNYKDLQEKHSQILTTIAERLSEGMPQSEVYDLMDDIVSLHDIVENKLGWLNIDEAFKLLDKIGK